MNPNWSPIQQPLYKWVRTIERILSAESIPTMSGQVINVFSDYSGDHEASRYSIVSVLYLDLQQFQQLERERRQFRAKYLPDGRRMSFKRLSDNQRQRALIPFLDIAHRITGMCVTLAIPKSMRNVCTDGEGFRIFQENLQYEATWTPEAFERMLRIVHLISLLIGGLSKPKQNIYWVSDEDPLFANDKVARDLKMMMERYTSYYVHHQLGELGLGTTKLDEGDRFEEDLAAIPDLVSGAVAEIVTSVAKASGGFIPAGGVAVPFSGSFSPKSELLCNWLADGSGNLKRPVVLFEQHHEREYSVSKFNFG